MNEANKYAQSQADAFRETLQYLVDTQNEQKKLQEQLAATNYQNMLDKINANKYNLNVTYEENARQAYVNKLLGAQEIGASMSRMGLSDSGFRATQDVLNNNQYSANLNKLALDRAAGLEDIGNQEAAALGDYNAKLLGIQSDANDRLLALNKYIEEQVQDKYNTEYSKFFANQQYQNQLAQQQWERNFAYAQLNAQNSGGSGGFADGNGNTNNITNNTQQGNIGGNGSTGNTANVDGYFNSQDVSNKSDYKNSDGSLNYLYNQKLKSYGKTVANLFGTSTRMLMDFYGVTSSGAYSVANDAKIYQGINANGGTAYYVWASDPRGNKQPLDVTKAVTEINRLNAEATAKELETKRKQVEVSGSLDTKLSNKVQTGSNLNSKLLK